MRNAYSIIIARNEVPRSLLSLHSETQFLNAGENIIFDNVSNYLYIFKLKVKFQ